MIYTKLWELSSDGAGVSVSEDTHGACCIGERSSSVESRHKLPRSVSVVFGRALCQRPGGCIGTGSHAMAKNKTRK